MSKIGNIISNLKFLYMYDFSKMIEDYKDVIAKKEITERDLIYINKILKSKIERICNG